MHSYLRAIGFRKSLQCEREVEYLLDNLMRTYEQKTAVNEEDGNRAYLELSRSFGPHIGLKMIGELDRSGYHRIAYFPYLEGSGVTSSDDLSVEKRVTGDGYTGLCDDGRVGVSLIFFVQNPAEVRRESILEQLPGNRVSATLTGLAMSGVILLPMKREEKTDESRKNSDSEHISLVTAAKNGNQEAIENLTMEEMDNYAMVTRRILHEDVLTIVDTYFMPYGLESDQYQVMGNILFYTKIYNSLTDEALYQMTIECNGLTFDICINEADLLGDIEVGRRFKGNIWLQGRINFEEQRA